MLSKNILKNNKLLFLCLLIVIIYSNGFASDNIEIEIIYPKDTQTISAVDSTFILGNIPDVNGYHLSSFNINERPVNVHEDGGFIGFIPITQGIFIFYVEAKYQIDKDYFKKNPNIEKEITLIKTIQTTVPSPIKSLPLDSLRIKGEYKISAENRYLTTGDRVLLSLHGTPKCKAFASIPGVVDSIPMSESNPQFQPYWGESVFGAGAVPDSMKIQGIYFGFYDIKATDSMSDAKIIYHLKNENKEFLAWQLISNNVIDRADIYQLLNMPETTLTFESFGTIFINDSFFPVTVEFTDSIQTIRYQPRKGYFSIFQPKGVKALAIASEGDWYKLQLAPNQYAWANKNSVRLLPKGILPSKSYLSVIRTFNSQNNLKIQFPLSDKHPFKIIEINRKEIKIQLYGVISDTDWIRYDQGDELLDYAVWNQPEPEVYELTLYLKDNIWGYDSYYEGNNFIFQLNKAPKDIEDLDGKRIVIDPGHSSDKGSVGPTGLTEADANLAISLKVREELTKKGAIVIMTRDDKRHVNLYDRPSIAKANSADLFISIHNNALPDGVNPFVNNGTSVYYYHPHSIELGRNVHAELMKELKLDNYGFYHGNLAVNRPTQYPAILVECAFMILPEQEALLKTEKFQKKIAKGIRKGIEKFLEDFEDD